MVTVLINITAIKTRWMNVCWSGHCLQYSIIWTQRLFLNYIAIFSDVAPAFSALFLIYYITLFKSQEEEKKNTSFSYPLTSNKIAAKVLKCLPCANLLIKLISCSPRNSWNRCYYNSHILWNWSIDPMSFDEFLTSHFYSVKWEKEKEKWRKRKKVLGTDMFSCGPCLDTMYFFAQETEAQEEGLWVNFKISLVWSFITTESANVEVEEDPSSFIRNERKKSQEVQGLLKTTYSIWKKLGSEEFTF